MAAESWQPIPGASLYDASSRGRIRSWNVSTKTKCKRATKPRLPKPRTRKDGYLQVNIRMDDGRSRVTAAVHRLVLLAFLGSPPGAWTASHMNSKPADNRIENLSWEALEINVRRQVPGGTRGKRRSGEGHHRTTLTADDVRTIRREYANGGVSHGQLAARFKLTRQAICGIVNRRTWKDVA